MWHTIAFVAESRRLDAKVLGTFALANEEKYGIATDRGEPEVNTWHVDKLVADFQEVALFATEDLSIKNLTASAAGSVDAPGTGVAQKSGLNREILDTAPALLLSLIAYKVKETGGQYLEAPTRKLKPSQRCPDCWTVKKKTLSERIHRCACGCVMDRDMASAQVVLRWAVSEHLGQELPQAA